MNAFSLMDSEKLTVPQAAKLMGIGQTGLRSLIYDGVLPVLRIGKKTILLKKDCEAYLRGLYGPVRTATISIRQRRPRLPDEIINSPHFK